MDVTGVSHIAVWVRDLDKSLVFYRDILGTHVTFDQVQNTTSGGLPHIHKHRRQTRRTVHVRNGEGCAMPSMVLTSHPGERPDGDPIKLDQIGISHPSFTVGDVEALAAKLQSNGVQLAGPMESSTNPQGEVSSIFVYDPDGSLPQFDNGGGV